MKKILLVFIILLLFLGTEVFADRINVTGGGGGAAGGAPTDADYLVGTANGSLSAEIVAGTTPQGELGNTWASPTLDDNVTVTGWVLGTVTATQLTCPTVILNLLDTVGAADMDYGSIDVLDHTFTSDGGTVILDGSIVTSGTTGQSSITQGIVFNDEGGSGAAHDTRAETGNEDNHFLVDASADLTRIGDFDTNYTQFSVTGAITQAGTATLTLQDGSDLVITSNPNAAQFLANDGDTGTGVFDFGGVTSLELPQDATVDAIGKCTLDTTDTTWIIHDGTAARVFGDDIMQTTFTVYDDGDFTDDEVPIWIAPKDYAVTIVQVSHATMPATSSVTYNIEERAWASLNSAGTDIWASDQAADSDGEDETDFSNAGIAAKAHLVAVPSAEANNPSLLTGVIYYRRNVE